MAERTFQLKPHSWFYPTKILLKSMLGSKKFVQLFNIKIKTFSVLNSIPPPTDITHFPTDLTPTDPLI